MKYYIAGEKRPENAPKALQEALQRYQITAVCIQQSNLWAKEIRDVLRKSGFVEKQVLMDHEVWFHSAR